MANTAIKIGDLPSVNTAVGNSTIVIIDGTTANTKQITLANLLGNSPANLAIRATRVITGAAPANSSANGTSGDIAYDTSYIYVATANNTWKRAALTTW